MTLSFEGKTFGPWVTDRLTAMSKKCDFHKQPDLFKKETLAWLILEERMKSVQRNAWGCRLGGRNIKAAVHKGNLSGHVLPSCAWELPEGFAAGERVGGAVRNLGIEIWSPLQRSEKSELGVSRADRTFFLAIDPQPKVDCRSLKSHSFIETHTYSTCTH